MIVLEQYVQPRIEFCHVFRPLQPKCVANMRIPPLLKQQVHLDICQDLPDPLRGLALELLSENRLADARFVLDAFEVYSHFVDLFEGYSEVQKKTLPNIS